MNEASLDVQEGGDHGLEGHRLTKAQKTLAAVRLTGSCDPTQPLDPSYELASTMHNYVCMLYVCISCRLYMCNLNILQESIRAGIGWHGYRRQYGGQGSYV